LGRLDDFLLPWDSSGRTQRGTVAGSLIDVIDVQVSKAGDRLTVNVGVLDPSIYRQCWASDVPSFAEEPQCTVRARLGQLMQDKGAWWPIERADVLDAVAVHASAFWERMHTPGTMEDFLAASSTVKARYPYPPPVIYLALLINKRGDRASACALLEDLRQKTLGAWRTRVREVAERLGCSLVR
jgi:hypothetical protein